MSAGMSFEDLCELAEKELRVGLADERLLERAFAEANGVAAHAHQIYWQLRAKALQKQDPGHVQELIATLAQQERRLRSRKESYRWFWAIVCVLGLVGAAWLPSFAFRAVGKPGPAFFIYLVLSIASLALSALAFIASRYHTDTE